MRADYCTVQLPLCTQPVSRVRTSSVRWSPRWSPDGYWIASDSRHDGNPEIYLIAAQGETPRRLTDDPATDVAPS